MKRFLLLNLLAAQVLIQFPATILAVPPQPLAQRLVIPPIPEFYQEVVEAVAIGEKYVLLGSPECDVKTQAGTLDRAGTVLVYEVATGRQVRSLRSATPKGQSLFGASVAVSGNTAYVGEPFFSEGGGANDAGAIHAIDIPTGRVVWTRVGEVGSRLGSSLAVDGEDLVAGCSQLPGRPDHSGAVLHLHSGTGALLKAYGLQMPASFDSFGKSLAVSRGLAVCGTPGRVVSGKTSQGQVFVIDLINESIVATLQAQDGAAFDEFGYGVAIMGRHILVGAPGAMTGGSMNRGAAYLFSSETLGFLGKLELPVAETGARQFGTSVALGNHMAVIGAPGYGAGGDSAVWLVDLNDGTLAKAMNPHPSSIKELGSALAVSGDKLVVGDRSIYSQANAIQGGAFLLRGIKNSYPQGLMRAARSGESALNQGAATYAGFGEAVLSPGGRMVFGATLQGPGVSAENRFAVGSTFGVSTEVTVRGGDMINGKKAVRFERLMCMNDSSALFTSINGADRRVGSLFSGGFFGSSTVPGQVTTGWVISEMQNKSFRVLRMLDSVVGPTGTSMNAASLKARAGEFGITPANDSFLGYHQPGLIVRVREGEASPAGLAYGELQPRLACAGKRLAWGAHLQGGSAVENQAVFVRSHDMNDAATVARRGGTPPLIGGGKFGAFTSIGVNSNGHVLIRARVAGAPAGASEGLWSNRTGTLAGISYRGAPARGCPDGVVVDRFLQQFIMDGGDVVYLAKVRGRGVHAGNDLGIWLSGVNGTELLMREGDVATDCGGARIGTIQRVDVDASGGYAVLVSLQSPAGSNQALFTGNAKAATEARRQPLLALRKGAQIDRYGSPVLSSIQMGRSHMDATGSGSKGAGKVTLNGRVAMVLGFADRTLEMVSGKP